MKRPTLLLLPLLALLACLNDTASTDPGVRLNAVISDGAHDADGDGSFEHPHFFFLPPMVPEPTPDAAFNASLQPAVQICELDVAANACTGNVFEFTMTTGPGSETIRRDLVEKHFIVNWHTDVTAAVPGATYRILVRAAPTLIGGPQQEILGFADVEIASTGKAAKSLASDQLIGLVDGRTLPITFYPGIGALGQCTAGGVTCAEAVVPPSGGLVVAVNADGEAEAFAEFPTDWTNQPTEVRIERIRDDRFEKTPCAGPLGTNACQFPLFFEFTTSREGLRFDRRVRIGVCNVENPFGDPFHPEDRSHLSLAIGGTPAGFRTLPGMDASDILGTCEGVTQTASTDVREGGWRGWLARAAALATSVVMPRPLYAAAALVDGGMGGSTDSFESPVGTVALTPAPDLLIPTGTPTVTPSTVAPGGTVQLSAWTIKNRGNVDLNSPTGSVRNGFYLSTDPVITSDDVFLTDNFNTNGVLEVGEQFDWGGPELTIPAGTAPGTYYIGILVDDTRLVTEFDESNNFVSTPLTVAITGAGSATVDGAISVDEWTNAGCVDFAAALPAGGTTPATFCVMNDASTLYAMVSFARTADPQSLAGVEFDTDGDGLLGTDPGDDLILIQQPPAGGFFRDEHVFTGATCPVGAVCTTEDTQADGTTDGSGAFQNDETRTVYEFAHPLASGDAHDVALSEGATVKIQAVLSIRDAVDGAAALTRLPAGSAGLMLLVQTIIR